MLISQGHAQDLKTYQGFRMSKLKPTIKKTFYLVNIIRKMFIYDERFKIMAYITACMVLELVTMGSISHSRTKTMQNLQPMPDLVKD